MAFINIQLEGHNIYIGTVPIKLFTYVHIVWIQVEFKTKDILKVLWTGGSNGLFCFWMA